MADPIKKKESKNPQEKPSGGLETVVLRNEFYRDGYRQHIRIITIMGIALIVMTIVAGGLAIRKLEPVYFASDNGRIVKLVPLSEPYIQSGAILQMVNEAATAAYTYDFLNYRKQLQALSVHFTTEGFESLMAANERSGNLNTIVAKKLVVSATPTGAPVIIKEGVLNGLYTWKAQVPMLILYQSSSEKTQSNVIIEMVLRRIPTLENPRGVGVVQFNEIVK